MDAKGWKHTYEPRLTDTLGMTLTYNSNQSVTLMMQAKIMQLKDQFFPDIDIADLPKVFSPNYPKWSSKKSRESSPIDSTTFRRKLGLLPYITITRHDVRPHFSFLSSNMQSPTQLDDDFLMHIFLYLITTIYIGLCFHGPSSDTDNQLFLTSASDAAFDVYHDSKSQLSLFGKLGVIDDPSGAVLANSKKEKGVTSDSATVAEAKAAHGGLKTLIVERQLLEDMGSPQLKPTMFYQDNQGFIDTVTKFGPCNDGLRHERRMLNVIQSHCQQDHPTIKIEYIKSQLNPSDILTKPLTTINHLRQLHRLLGKQQGITDLIDLYNKTYFHINRSIEINFVQCQVCSSDTLTNRIRTATDNAVHNKHPANANSLPPFIPVSTRATNRIEWNPFVTFY